MTRMEAVSIRKHANAVHLRIWETSSRCDPNFTYHFHPGGLVNIRTTLMYGVGPGHKDLSPHLGTAAGPIATAVAWLAKHVCQLLEFGAELNRRDRSKVGRS